MEKICTITGQGCPEADGTTWHKLRGNVREFVTTLHDTSQWTEDTFISYKALNDMMRHYITNITAQEVTEHRKLEARIKLRFEKDETLRPLRHIIDEPKLSVGDRLADKIAEFGGSWPFIILFFSVLIIWMAVNTMLLRKAAFDPFPYILLNLVLSCLAAIQAPIIMMSQNREAAKDRQRSDYDFKVNLKAETEVRLLHEKLDHLLTHHHRGMMEMLELQTDLTEQIQDRLQALHEMLARTNGMQQRTEDAKGLPTTQQPNP